MIALPGTNTPIECTCLFVLIRRDAVLPQVWSLFSFCSCLSAQTLACNGTILRHLSRARNYEGPRCYSRPSQAEPKSLICGKVDFRLKGSCLISTRRENSRWEGSDLYPLAWPLFLASFETPSAHHGLDSLSGTLYRSQGCNPKTALLLSETSSERSHPYTPCEKYTATL